MEGREKVLGRDITSLDRVAREGFITSVNTEMCKKGGGDTERESLLQR